MTHGDFDYAYLAYLALGPQGRPRFGRLSFAGHFDMMMFGRRGISRPPDEASLNPNRKRSVDVFTRLRREHGVRIFLAHNMTVTPTNLGQIAQVIRDCHGDGFGMSNAVVMNFWPVGAILAGLLAYLTLDTFALSAATSWRYMFILGGLLVLVVLYFRRRIPESPQWLLSQGRPAEAEQILCALESPGAAPTIVDRARNRPGGRGVAALVELIRHYPGRLVLGSLLDLAEAFGFYGLFARHRTVLHRAAGRRHPPGRVPLCDLTVPGSASVLTVNGSS